jgi:hypothetical protein
MTLLCDHIVHSRCFIQVTANYSSRYLECPSCGDAILPEEDEPVAVTETLPTSPDTILNLFETNPQFRVDVKQYMEKGFQVCSAFRSAKSMRSRVTREFKVSIAPAKADIRAKQRLARREYARSEEFKAWRKELAKWKTLQQTLQTTYSLTDISLLERSLREKRGFARWPRVCPYLYVHMRTGMYIRI